MSSLLHLSVIVFFAHKTCNKGVSMSITSAPAAVLLATGMQAII